MIQACNFQSTLNEKLVQCLANTDDVALIVRDKASLKKVLTTIVTETKEET